jgi:hypothetical protein
MIQYDFLCGDWPQGNSNSESIFYPTNALRDTIHMAHTISYLFRYRRAVFRVLLQRKCTNQPANTCCFLSCMLTKKRYFVKVHNVVKTKLIVMIVYSILLCYNALIISRLSCQFFIAFICMGDVSKHRF